MMDKIMATQMRKTSNKNKGGYERHHLFTKEEVAFALIRIIGKPEEITGESLLKNLIERLQQFNPRANIYFTLDLSSGEGFPKVEILEISKFQLVGVLHKANP